MDRRGKSVLPLAKKISTILGAQPERKHYNFYDV
jgi:hypothetical protein